MKIIFGIGNPGTRYLHNRHNIGFMFLDYFAIKYSLGFSPSKGDYNSAKGKIQDSEFLLVKPATYVNNSGLAAAQVLKQTGSETQEFIVIVDDVNINFSEIRLRESGGDGGHNGLRSIIYHFVNDKFPRVRIGIGQDFKEGNLSEFVLSDFNDEEKKELVNIFEKTSLLVEEFIIGGKTKLLNANSRLFNQDKKENKSNQTDIN
ncbi:MAG: aminoacyl-tRNA hydrolase [Ignavibacteriaceae bacterium]